MTLHLASLCNRDSGKSQKSMCGADGRANGWTDVRPRDYQIFFGCIDNHFFFYPWSSAACFARVRTPLQKRQILIKSEIKSLTYAHSKLPIILIESLIHRHSKISNG